MLKIYGVPSRDFVRWISEIIIGKNLDKWVDLGCGNGNYLQSLKITFKQGIAVDTAEKIPNLPNNFIYENCFVDEWLKKNKIANFDLISMFDLVEHFPKEEALVLINKAKNLTNNLLITTPLGFLKQDAATHPEFANNPYLWHRSGFSPEDFERNGFLVFALRNYHYKPIGNNKSFDKLVCFWTKNQSQYLSLNFLIRIKNAIYLLWPIHFYRMIRDTIIKPFF